MLVEVRSTERKEAHLGQKDNCKHIRPSSRTDGGTASKFS